MELPKSRLPNLNAPGLTTDAKLNLLAEYLLTLEKNIRFVLNNLEEDNLSQDVVGKLDDMSEQLRRLEESVVKRGEGNA